jgi:guanosine-3',5'-bis(diphosphate) 3'-pyrophosphohydrolase
VAREVAQTPAAGEENQPAAGSGRVQGAPRRRQLLSRLTGSSRTSIPELEPLLRTLRQFHPKANRQVVERAYVMAAHLHHAQVRRSGEPYITHPLAVATILAELGMTPTTLAAALLHDTVEDTDYPLERLREDFGDEVARLVDGVTKLDKVQYGEASAAETVRKMVVAMARDIRVLVIKLADRLHNMRTIGWLPEDKQQKKARETLEIYAPLAHRLGMNTIKWELEDLAFATLYPKMYDEIVRLVGQRAPSRDEYLGQIIDLVNEELRMNRIRARVYGRPKHYYSVYQKMIVRGRDFADIYDLVGVRILVDSIPDCYGVLGLLHAKWNPVPGRFKDYIASPRYGVYRSLHTTVIGPEGKPVEVQIRTNEMHQQAEFGVAAHWRYKQGRSGIDDGPDEFAWLRQLLEWQRETEDPDEFLDSLRYELGKGELFVFTPKGDVISLPVDATPVDFAYSVHTEVGHRTIGARVNGKLVPLDSKLDNGDTVEIFTSKTEGQGPSRDWLTFVVSPRARSKIRAWFSRERREEALENGKDALSRELRRHSLPVQRLLNTPDLLSIAAYYRMSDVSALYTAIGEGRLDASAVVDRLIASRGGSEAAVDDSVEDLPPPSMRTGPIGDPGVVVAGSSDVWVKLAKCCTPVPGDDIVGFVTRGSGVSVHRRDCVNYPGLAEQPDRLVEVTWRPSADSVFLVSIQVEALDRARLLSDVTRVLSDHHVNILSASSTTNRDRIAISRFTFEMGDPKHLGAVLKEVRGVEGVFDATRI